MARIISGVRMRSLKYEIMLDMASRVRSGCGLPAATVVVCSATDPPPPLPLPLPLLLPLLLPLPLLPLLLTLPLLPCAWR